jgi:hypothetical protein
MQEEPRPVQKGGGEGEASGDEEEDGEEHGDVTLYRKGGICSWLFDLRRWCRSGVSVASVRSVGSSLFFWGRGDGWKPSLLG